MCNFRLDRRAGARALRGRPARTTSPEIERLCEPDGPVGDGLLDVAPEALTVTRRGRLFVRNICMAFDRYLAGARRTARSFPERFENRHS